MTSRSRGTDAGRTDNLHVRIVARLAILVSLAYVGWGLLGLFESPLLAAPYFALEVIGLAQLALLTWQSEAKPSRRLVDGSESRVVDLIVTCTFHTPDALERTLIGLRSVRNIRRTIVVMRPDREDLAAIADRFDVEVVEREGNHVDGFWAGAQVSRAPFAAWLEAGQIPMPDFISSTVGKLSETAAPSPDPAAKVIVWFVKS